MPRFYSVKVGRVPGVYKTWVEANAQVSHYSGALHRSFPNLGDAVAWLGVPVDQLDSWVQAELGVHQGGNGPPPPYSANSSLSIPFNGNPISAQHMGDSPGRLVPSVLNSNLATDRHRSEPVGLRGTSVDDCEIDRLVLDDVEAVFPGQYHPIMSSNPFQIRVDRVPTSPPVAAVSGRLNGLEHKDLSHSTRERDPQAPLSSTPHTRQTVPGLTIPGLSPFAGHLAERSVGSANRVFPQPDFSAWSSTNHSGWVEDSILSNIFHPPAAGPPSSSLTEDLINSSQGPATSDDGVYNTGRTRRTREKDIDPMQSSDESVLGAPDSNTLNHRIHLLGASTTVTNYSPGLRYIIGRHAINYLYMHYYSAGSAVAIAEAYLTWCRDGESFVRLLVDRNMAPRHAAFLWAIISPEVMLPPGAPGKKYTSGEFSASDQDDQDMSFVRGGTQ